jgi:hypothetical protein
VVDVDPRHGGHITLRNLEQEHGPLQLSWRSITGGAGLHAFFAARAGELANGRLGWGIDFKGTTGGYVVVPASRHVSGRHYAWEIDPRDVPLAPLPGWIIEAVRRPKTEPRVVPTFDLTKAPAKIAGIIQAAAFACEGERNNLCYWAASRLAELADQQVISRNDAVAIAVEAASRSGLPRTEALRTAQSAIYRGQS